MFWRVLTVVLRTSTLVHRTAAAIGATVIITIATRDFIRSRRIK